MTAPRGFAELIEIFSAIQGEGPIVGRRQVFVRFGRCDVKCNYCDTPLCHVDLPTCQVESSSGGRVFETHPNPVAVSDIVTWVRRLNARHLHHSVSFTGGEPLLHAAAIREAAGPLREDGLKIYLETNGHLPKLFAEVAESVDIVGMDIKTPSTTGFAARHDDNRRFLEMAIASSEVFVKIVVGDGMPDEELRAALAVVADVAPGTTVVLQPVTPFEGRGTPPSPARLIEMNDLALGILPEVLVIPQTHKMIDQL